MRSTTGYSDDMMGVLLQYSVGNCCIDGEVDRDGRDTQPLQAPTQDGFGEDSKDDCRSARHKVDDGRLRDQRGNDHAAFVRNGVNFDSCGHC